MSHIHRAFLSLLSLALITFLGCHGVVVPVPVPDPSPIPIPVVTNAPVPPTDEAATEKEHPKATLAPQYDTVGAVLVPMGKGGMRWNPATSRGQGKLIWPAKYTHSIAWVTFWAPDGSGKANPKIAHPHEAGNRERSYYPGPIESAPRILRARAHRPGQSDLWTEISDTRKEEG